MRLPSRPIQQEKMSELPQKLRERIAGTTLPSLPHVLLKVLRTFNSERVNIADLSRLINLDVALRNRIVALANPLSNQKPAQIVSLEQSIVALGLDTVRTIAISAAIAEVFKPQSPIRRAEAKRLWRHAAHAAAIAKRLAELTQYMHPEEAHLAGLLHDVGQLVLAAAFPEQYAQVLAEPDELRQIDIERQQFGADHAQVGFWLMGHYQLRSIIGDAVLYHHEPTERIVDAHLLVRIVSAAHALSSDIAAQVAGGIELAERLFKLPANEILAVVEHARKEVRQDADYLALNIEKGVESIAQDTAKRRKPVEIELSDDDNPIDAELAEEIRSIMLLNGVRQAIAAAAGEPAVLAAIRKSAQILFGVDATFFIYEPGSNLLLVRRASGDAASNDQISDQIVIPYDSGDSLIAQAVRGDAPLNSFSRNAELAIIDQQVIRATQSAGILCLPLIIGEKTLGAIVFGVNAETAAALSENMHFIRAFANLAASSLDAFRSREAYERLIEANREAETAGHLRKIVHEVSNPLSIIKNYISILGMKLGPDDPSRQDLEVLNEEIDRIVGIIRSLSDPHTPAVDMTAEADPNLIVSEVVELCRKSLFAPNRISLKLDLDQSMETVATNKNGVKQILLNLVKNAAEAMVDGGTLSLSTADSVNRDGEDYVAITISDTGPGIPPYVMSHLFEPGNSSKGNGHAGLGLAIAKNIVKELRGFITCRNTQRGVSFEILLPKKPSGSIA